MVSNVLLCIHVQNGWVSDKGCVFSIFVMCEFLAAPEKQSSWDHQITLRWQDFVWRVLRKCKKCGVEIQYFGAFNSTLSRMSHHGNSDHSNQSTKKIQIYWSFFFLWRLDWTKQCKFAANFFLLFVFCFLQATDSYFTWKLIIIFFKQALALLLCWSCQDSGQAWQPQFFLKSQILKP